MKIALFVHCYFPGHIYGTEGYTSALANMFRASGHEVVVVTATFPGEPPQSDFVDEYQWDGIQILRIDRNQIPNRAVRDTYYMPELRPALERILRRERPDVAHICHLVNHTAALIEVLDALDIPTVATFTDFFGVCFNSKLQAHDNGLCSGPGRDRMNCLSCYLKEAGANLDSPLLRWASRPAVNPIAARTARYAPFLLPSSWREEIAALVERPDVLKQLYRRYSAAIAPTRFLHDAYRANGFDGRLEISHFGVDVDRSPKRRHSDGCVHFGFVGQIAHHKGIHLLIEAMARQPKGRCRLDIWGDERSNPAYAATLRELAAGLPVEFRGTFPPADMADRLGEIDVLVIPSLWYENSPLILLNAIATHTPVIVSDVAGMTEFVTSAVNGFAVERGDVASLAEAMAIFCRDLDLSSQMSMGTHFDRTTSDMAKDVLRIYEAIV